MKYNFKIKDWRQRKFLSLGFFIIALLTCFFLFFILRGLSSGGGKVSVLLDKVFKKEAPKPEIVYRAEENIIILEGWTNDDVKNYLSEEKALFLAEDFIKSVGYKNTDNLKKEQEFSRDWSSLYDFLDDKPDNLSLEGYLFPDTYRVFASTSPNEVVSRLLDNFNRKLTSEMRAEIKRQGKSIHEIITMASIIEKEAPIFAQKDITAAKIVSGIFWNRLKIGMALQSDATLSYILNDKKPAHSGAELQVESPYNTYKYRGLPPGPIANPGMIAILAAIYPAKTDYFFFLTTFDGSKIYYAKNYDEHLRNKYLYMK